MFFLVFGLGLDWKPVVNRFQGGPDWSGFQPLPGGIPLLDFSYAINGQRVNLFGLGHDRHCYTWYSNDAGATWAGPADLGAGLYSRVSGLIGGG